MMNIIWAKNIFYFKWIDSKINIPFNLIQASELHNQRHWISSLDIPRSRVSHLKINDLDQYSLYGGSHTQVNDRFSRI